MHAKTLRSINEPLTCGFSKAPPNLTRRTRRRPPRAAFSLQISATQTGLFAFSALLNHTNASFFISSSICPIVWLKRRAEEPATGTPGASRAGPAVETPALAVSRCQHPRCQRPLPAPVASIHPSSTPIASARCRRPAQRRPAASARCQRLLPAASSLPLTPPSGQESG